MKVQELCDLKNLLIKWNKDVAFTPTHTATANKLITWIENLTKTKVKNKEV